MKQLKLKMSRSCEACGGSLFAGDRIYVSNNEEYPRFVCSEECAEHLRVAELLSCYGEPSRPSLIESALNLVQKMYEQSGDKPDHLVVSPTTYKNLRKALLRNSMPTKLGKTEHGLEMMEIQGVTIVQEDACAPEKMYALSSKRNRAPFAFEGRITSLEVKKKFWHG